MFFVAGATVIQLPYWFLGGLSASIALVTGINWSRRFTLLTLLIAMTLAAVVLGLTVSALRK